MARMFDPAKSPVSHFITYHYRHFNSAALVDAAEGYRVHLEKGGKMLVTLAGAMSTAELGLSLAEMIRQGKVHAISCTGANLEEDVYNLVAHEHYRRIPNYRDLTAAQEAALLDKGMNRVTDTCIPEDDAMRVIDKLMVRKWALAEESGERYFPHEYFYQLIGDWMAMPESERPFQIDPKNSWLVAAWEKNLPMFVPGWEDSTLGNACVAETHRGNLRSLRSMKSGLEYMAALVEWYRTEATDNSYGFFQVGGGIAGDFPICVVPLINQDILRHDDTKSVPLWGYFCQISDSTTSYGSYSGAVPNEKITWGKLGVDTPRFIVESDATIVAPLVFAYVLGW